MKGFSKNKIKAPIEMRSTTVAKLHTVTTFAVVHDMEDPGML